MSEPTLSEVSEPRTDVPAANADEILHLNPKTTKYISSIDEDESRPVVILNSFQAPDAMVVSPSPDPYRPAVLLNIFGKSSNFSPNSI